MSVLQPSSDLSARTESNNGKESPQTNEEDIQRLTCINQRLAKQVEQYEKKIEKYEEEVNLLRKRIEEIAVKDGS